mgnify:CR=1 FL=1|tara:strand:+ start:435 stop:725 length:291 start_codon:yes stop_codon:yes gene_type:complete
MNQINHSLSFFLIFVLFPRLTLELLHYYPEKKYLSKNAKKIGLKYSYQKIQKNNSEQTKITRLFRQKAPTSVTKPDLEKIGGQHNRKRKELLDTYL